MAKKRVHEIAKAQGLSSKEVLAALKAAGIEAKAAASSVEEGEALKALSGAKGDGGAATATKAKPKAGSEQQAPPKAAAPTDGQGTKQAAAAKPAAPTVSDALTAAVQTEGAKKNFDFK